MKNAIVAFIALAITMGAISQASAIDRIGWSTTRETMYVHGEIQIGDAKVISDAIIANKKRLRGVMLNSGGGSVAEAVRLVELIQGLEFDTGVTQGGICASACFMLWAAGKNRYLYPDSRIGIHSASMLGESGKMEENPVSLAVTMLMARTYVDLKVPVSLIGQMVITPPNRMYFLDSNDMLAMNASFVR